MIQNAAMFAHVPAGKPSLRAAYQAWLEAKKTTERAVHHVQAKAPEGVPPGGSVAIVGGGMAGLYCALLLQNAGVNFQLFEAHPDRLGGRVYTHRFNDQTNQYFEAGAMRLPQTDEQQPVFDLVDYLNERVAPADKVDLIPYNLYDATGNLAYVNGKRDDNGQTMTVDYANRNTKELGFPVADAFDGVNANDLLAQAIKPFADLLERDFNAGFQAIIKLDNMSFYTYLTTVLGWSMEKVNYVEVMTSATNQFQNSFPELVIESLDFSGAAWKTIANGMDRLPNACASLLAPGTIQMNSPVEQVEQMANGKTGIHIKGELGVREFDRVILALPPAAVRMIKTPSNWPATRTQANRAMHYEPLYKIGMRFKTRFWEQVPRASKGGQSITDLRTRWCVYPSYGIGDTGEGVLLLYSWMTDAYNWLPMGEDARVRIGLDDLQTLYQDTVNVEDQFIEAFSVAWPTEWATGDAMFFPGQFTTLFNVARLPQDHVYFAGEHLSVHHTWIVGAIDSALLACQQVLNDSSLKPLAGQTHHKPPHNYDYSAIVAFAQESIKKGS